MTVNTISAVSARQPGIRFPTRDELANTYRGLIAGAAANGTLKPLRRAPAGVGLSGGIDVTPRGLVGVSQFAYVLNGTLYVKTVVASPNVKPMWAKVGPAPMF